MVSFKLIGLTATTLLLGLTQAKVAYEVSPFSSNNCHGRPKVNPKEVPNTITDGDDQPGKSKCVCWKDGKFPFEGYFVKPAGIAGWEPNHDLYCELQFFDDGDCLGTLVGSMWDVTWTPLKPKCHSIGLADATDHPPKAAKSVSLLCLHRAEADAMVPGGNSTGAPADQ